MEVTLVLWSLSVKLLRVATVFKNGTFALTVLLDVVLLLSGGQCYGRAWSCSP